MGKFDNVKFEKFEMSPAWDFETTPTIVGILTSIEEDVGPNHSKLYTLDTEGGDISVWGSTVIDTRLKNAELGEVIKINFLGKKKSETRKGSSYNDFEVFHGKMENLENVEYDLDSISKQVS